MYIPLGKKDWVLINFGNAVTIEFMCEHDNIFHKKIIFEHGVTKVCACRVAIDCQLKLNMENSTAKVMIMSRKENILSYILVYTSYIKDTIHVPKLTTLCKSYFYPFHWAWIFGNMACGCEARPSFIPQFLVKNPPPFQKVCININCIDEPIINSCSYLYNKCTNTYNHERGGLNCRCNFCYMFYRFLQPPVVPGGVPLDGPAQDQAHTQAQAAPTPSSHNNTRYVCCNLL